MNTTSKPVTVETIDAKLRDLCWRTVEEELAKLERDFKYEPDVISSIAKIREQLRNSPATLKLDYLIAQSRPEVWPLMRWSGLGPLDADSILDYLDQHGVENFQIYIGKIASAKEFMGWMDQVFLYI